MIFLSFRFYVKSIFWDYRSAKSAISTLLETLNFDFYEFLHFWKAGVDPKNHNQSTVENKKRNFGDTLESERTPSS